MNLLQLVVVLIVIGVGLWAISLIPMDATIKRIINVVVILVVVLWLLNAVFHFGNLGAIHF